MTAPHISDELPRMLTGEAERDVVLSAAAHLRDCIDCQQELVFALVAHASLSSAQRFAPEIVTGPLTGNFTEAAESADSSRVAQFPGADLSVGRHADPEAAALPDLSAVFAQVRAEAEAESHAVESGGTDTSRRERKDVVSLDDARSRRTRYLVGAAAAAVLVAGAGVVYGVTSSSDSSAPQGRSVALSAYDIGRTTATAKVGDGSMSIDATSLPKLAGKRYEVWLTDSSGRSLEPIGWIGNDGKAALSVPDELMSKYSNVQVSVQDLSADDYTYSGVSVLRGALS